MRVSRTLRNRKKVVRVKPVEAKPDPMKGFQAAGGGSQVERHSRRFDGATDNNRFADMPIIMASIGFRPNEENH